ncbi:MAG: hypothetical protein AAFX90_01450 [Pseudomonadota bacterium]
MSGLVRLILILPVVLTLFAAPTRAQTHPPSIVEFWIKADSLLIEISLNAEMFLAGLDPDTQSDVAGNARYRELRRLVSSELEVEVRGFVDDWAASLQVEVEGPVRLSYEGVRIPVVGDPDEPRLSKLLLTAPLREGASALRLTWPSGHGPAVIKQQRVEAPYTGYLMAGETSPLIPLQGGAALSGQQTIQVFLVKGAEQIVTDGMRVFTLALALVFLSLSPRSLVLQLVFLSLGAVFGLALSAYGALVLSSVVTTMSLTAAVVVLALWNLILRGIHVFRLLAVFAIGLLLGNALSQSLSAIGAPPDHLPPALLGYAIGYLAVLSAAAATALAVVTVIAGGSHRLRSRISVLGSILIAGLGVYWVIEPWLFS